MNYLSLKGLLPAIVFVLSKKNCEKYAASAPTLIDHTVSAEIRKQFHALTAHHRALYETAPQYYTVLANLERGIGVHHAGMIPILKETVEILFQQGLLKVLFVTETFAVGVNMPAKVAAFTGLTKYCNDGFRFLTTDEYKQMAGRAGRRGLDTTGTSILLPLRDLQDMWDGPQLESVMVGACSSVESKFTFNYQFVLSTVATKATSLEEATSIVVDFAKTSLLHQELVAASATLEQQLNDTSTAPPFDAPTMEVLATYHEVVQKVEQGGMRKKQYVKLKKQLTSMETEDTVKQYPRYKLHLDQRQQAQQCQQTLEAHHEYLTSQAQLSLRYLIKQDYLDQSCQPTLRGVIASMINECNEIILTEMMLLMLSMQDLTFDTVIAMLAMMIPSNQEGLSVDDLQVPPSVVKCIKQVGHFIQTMEKDEFDAGIELHNDWNLHIGFVDQAYLWAQGKSIKEILAAAPVMEGDFIKNIIRLNSIVGQMARVCELTKQSGLLKTLECAEQKLIRDFVTMDSLYV